MSGRFHDDAQAVQSEMAAVLARIDESQIAAAVSLLAAAPRVFVLGVGREGLAARGFAMRLMHLGTPTHWGWDDTTPAVTADDLVLIVNGSGSIGHLDYVFDQLVHTGASTIVVTADPTARTPRASTLALAIPATVYRGEGALVPSAQPMGSLFEQCAQLVFDLMILELIRRDARDHSELASRHRNFE